MARPDGPIQGHDHGRADRYSPPAIEASYLAGDYTPDGVPTMRVRIVDPLGDTSASEDLTLEAARAFIDQAAAVEDQIGQQ